MGEAKRRKAREAVQAAAERAAEGERWRAEWAEIERIASEDPDDRAIREAHGFSYDDDWQSPTVLCRNGCGLSYDEVLAGKVRTCLSSDRGPT